MNNNLEIIRIMHIIHILFNIRKSVTTINHQEQVAMGLSKTMNPAYCLMTRLEKKAEDIKRG